MQLYLSSYGLGHDTTALTRWLCTHGQEILLIPSARDRSLNSKAVQWDREALEALGFSVRLLPLERWFGNPKGLRRHIGDCRAFFTGGGNVFVLRKAMELSGFDEFLRDISTEKDYFYGGYSAGICVLAPSLRGLEKVDCPHNPYDTSPVLYDGVGLLDFLPLPHYQSDHPESHLIDSVVSHCRRKRIPYRTLRDGDVLFLDTNKNP